MLQFLKKSAARRRSTGHGSGEEENVNKSAAAGEVITNGGTTTMTTSKAEPVSDEEALREAECYWMDQQNQDKCPPVAKSRLSRNLLDILAEQSCICYFVQFLETKSALPLVKFWLEVEGFKAAAAESVRLDERIAKGVTGTVGQHRGLNRSVSSDNYDSVSFLSVDCDSISTFSENAFEDVGTPTTTEDLTTASSRSCTPIPPTPLPVLLEEDRKPATNATNEEAMRQSLTDDEKLKLEEQPAVTGHVQQNGGGFNSLVISDAVRIYRKFLVSSSPYFIEVPATILSAISLALCGGGTCSEQIFDDAQQYLVEVMEKNYLNAFLESGFYCKYTFEVLSSDTLTLKDILCSEMALFYFMEYLEQKAKRHTLEFCVSASHFHRTTSSSGTGSSNQAQADAVVLYQKYFSLQATCSLTLSDKVRFLIEEQICSQDLAVIKRCFELPSRIIERFLERQYFQGFLKSPLYAKFLSELMGKIGSNPAEEASGNFGILAGRKQIFSHDRRIGAAGNQRRGHRKTFSDVTSDSTNRAKQQQHSPFISSQNTLLAMPDVSFHRKRLNPPPTSGGSSDLMLIDSRQLYNPDLLWRRNSVAGLTFGRVDALGRYERDFDMAEPPQDDDRWSKNRLKKAMRKLVNLPEDKAQEELAWQVAEMIVKDITSVTMNAGTGETPAPDISTSTASS